jgi:hypothetical protein
MSDRGRVAAPDGLALAEVRAALAQVIEGCRARAWDALRAEDGPAELPVSWLEGHVGELLELDRGLALLERRAVG